MSLKYDSFMLKGTVADFRARILEAYPRSIDETNLMHQAYNWYMRPITEGFPIEPRSFELESYMKDCGQKGFHIWFMEHPKAPGVVVGGYTNNWISRIDFMAAFTIILEKCGIDEILMQSYSGVVNDGDIYILHISPIRAKEFPHRKSEEQFWDKYIDRVDGLCGYPVKSWHDYLDHQIHLVPWTHSILVQDRPWIHHDYGAKP